MSLYVIVIVISLAKNRKNQMYDTVGMPREGVHELYSYNAEKVSRARIMHRMKVMYIALKKCKLPRKRQWAENSSL